MSVAIVQKHLQASGRGEEIEIGPYLSTLCDSLAISMIRDRRPLSLDVRSNGGIAGSSQAVSLGLITTELVINALKHAFPGDRAGRIVVSYDVEATGWTLSVSDDGVGRADDGQLGARPGLGTSIIQALAHQLDARVRIVEESGGTMVSIVHTA